jgi:hypothetical protein
MKGFRRALSLALASALALSLFAMSASANEGEEETPAPTDPATTTETTTTVVDPQVNLTQSVDNPITSLPVSKTVKVTSSGVALPSEDFYIQMVPANDVTTGTKDDEGNAVTAGIALTNSVLTYSFDGSQDTSSGQVKETESFKLNFTSDFTNAGVYRYYVTEVVKTVDSDNKVTYSTPTNPTNDNDEFVGYIEYDLTTYTVDLYVAANSSGEYVVYTTRVHSSALTENNEKPSYIDFENTVHCANIEISKVVTGIPYKADELFDFYILIPEGGDTITLTADDTVQAKIFNGTQQVTDERTKDGIVELKVNGESIDDNVMTEGTKVQLKDGEHLEIYAPVSMIYKVCEANYSGEEYTTTALYTERGDLDVKGTGTSPTLTTSSGTSFTATNDAKVYEGGTYADEDKVVCVRGTTNTDKNSVVFTNAREVTTPTGISLDVIPYVLVAVIAACGAILLISAKKRRTNR